MVGRVATGTEGLEIEPVKKFRDLKISNFQNFRVSQM
jgi:hypothetical protein